MITNDSAHTGDTLSWHVVTAARGGLAVGVTPGFRVNLPDGTGLMPTILLIGAIGESALPDIAPLLGDYS